VQRMRGSLPHLPGVLLSGNSTEVWGHRGSERIPLTGQRHLEKGPTDSVGCGGSPREKQVEKGLPHSFV
jgi:hypothetical protein